MKQIFLHYMQNIRAAGIPIAVHTPANLPTFFSRGHYPATRTQHLSLKGQEDVPFPAQVKEHSLLRDLAPLHNCYHNAHLPYSGMVARSLADFAYKFQDYACDDARCYVIPGPENNIDGYCVFYPGESKIHAEEVVARNPETYQLLVAALAHTAKGKQLHVKLPPDLSISYPGAELEVRPQGVMGVANVGALLKAMVGDASLRFAIIDSTVPQNAGIWNGAGQPDSGNPHITLEAGRLGQIICGYADLSELEAQGHAQIHDKAAAMDICFLLPQRPCFIVDEY